MNKLEQIPHLRSAFRQLAEEGKRRLVAELRDVAAELLAIRAERVERPLSALVRRKYEVSGRVGWDFESPEDALEFCYLAKREPQTTQIETRACDLLRECSRALLSESINEKLIECVLDAYAACDIPALHTGMRFATSRRPKKAGPVRKKIRSLLSKNPALRNGELWEAIVHQPPRGWQFVASPEGGWLDGPSAGQNMGRRRFFNVCGEERKRLNSEG